MRGGRLGSTPIDTARSLRPAAGAAGFARADDELTRLDRKTLKPAILMMEGYRRIFHRLQARGWAERNGRLRLKAIDRLQLLRLAMSPAT